MEKFNYKVLIEKNIHIEFFRSERDFSVANERLINLKKKTTVQ